MPGCGCGTLGRQNILTAGCVAGGAAPWPREYSSALERAHEKCSACAADCSVLLVAVCGLHRRAHDDKWLCRQCAARAMLQRQDNVAAWQPQGRYRAVVLTLLAARALEQLHDAKFGDSCTWRLVFHSESHARLSVAVAGVDAVEVLLGTPVAGPELRVGARVRLWITPPDVLLHESPALLFLCSAPHSNLLPMQRIARAVVMQKSLNMTVVAEERGLRATKCNAPEAPATVLVFDPSRASTPGYFQSSQGTPPPDDSTHTGTGAPGAPARPAGPGPRSGEPAALRAGRLLAFPRAIATAGRASPAAAVRSAHSEWHAQLGCCQYCGLVLHPPTGAAVGLVNKFVLAVPRGGVQGTPASFDIEHLAGVGVLAADPMHGPRVAQVLLCPQCAHKTLPLAALVAEQRPGAPAETPFAYLQRRSGMPDLLFCQLVTRRAPAASSQIGASSDSDSASDGEPGSDDASIGGSGTDSDSDEHSAGSAPSSAAGSDSDSDEHISHTDQHRNDPPRTRGDETLVLAHFSNLRTSRLLWLRLDAAVLRELYTGAGGVSSCMHSPDLHRREYLGTPALKHSVSLSAEEAAVATGGGAIVRPGWSRCGTESDSDEWVVCANEDCKRHRGAYAISSTNTAVFRRSALLVEQLAPTGEIGIFTPRVAHWAPLLHSSPRQAAWVRRSFVSGATTLGAPKRSSLSAALQAAQARPGVTRIYRVFRRLGPCTPPRAPWEFESPQAECLGIALPAVSLHAITASSLHAYAFLVHVLGTLAYHEIAHSADVQISLQTFLYLVWKRYAVDAGTVRDGSAAIAREELLGLPKARWQRDMLEHVRALVVPPGGELRAMLAETQSALARAQYAAPRSFAQREDMLFRTGVPADLRAMLRLVWALEMLAAPADARACGFRAKRQLMLMHYLLAAFTTTDTHRNSMVDAALCQLRLDLSPLP